MAGIHDETEGLSEMRLEKRVNTLVGEFVAHLGHLSLRKWIGTVTA